MAGRPGLGELGNDRTGGFLMPVWPWTRDVGFDRRILAVAYAIIMSEKVNPAQSIALVGAGVMILVHAARARSGRGHQGRRLEFSIGLLTGTDDSPGFDLAPFRNVSVCLAV